MMDHTTKFPVSYRESPVNKGLYFTGVIFLGLIAAFMFSVVLSMMFDTEKTTETGLLVFGFLVCTGIPLTVSDLLIVSYKQKLKKRRDEKNCWINHHVIRLANIQNGRVSIPDIMTNLQKTIEEARDSSDRLVQKGALEVLVTPTAAVVYQLSGYDKEKADRI